MSVRFCCRRHGLHSFVCKRALGRSARHHALNDLVARSYAAAGVPVAKGVPRKRACGVLEDGREATGRQSGKSLCWDVTVICPLAESYFSGAAREAGAAAEVAASRKDEKYAELDSRYLFRPIAVKTFGVFKSLANNLLKEIGLKISVNTGESSEASFLY